MTKLTAVAVASLLAALGAAAPAATQDAGAYTITYDETTAGFGALASWFVNGVDAGFQWNLKNSISEVLVGDGQKSPSFTLPSFSIVANPGWVLSGPVTGFLGNLGFTELNGGTTSVSFAGNVGLVGGTAVPVSGNLDRTVTSSQPGVYALGYYASTLTSAAGPLPSLAVSGASITLTLAGIGPDSFASIQAQPQNELRVGFLVAALPVPEPSPYALLLAGLAAVGLVVGRRR